MLRLFGDGDTLEKIAGADLGKSVRVVALPKRRIEFSVFPTAAGSDQATQQKAMSPGMDGTPDRVIDLTGDVSQDGGVEILSTSRSGKPDSADFKTKILRVIADTINDHPTPKSPTEENPVSIDVPLAGLQASTEGQHWDVANGGNFRVRRHAHLLLDHALPGLPGDCDDVGVVIVDAGVSAAYVQSLGGTFGGGWQLLSPHVPAQVGQYNHPHERAADGHGNMVARNILAQAPGAVIYDAPLLPKRVEDLDVFSSDAKLLFDAIRFVIRNPLGSPFFPQHKNWIIVNAWGVATSFADASAPFRYANSRKHRLNAAVIRLATLDQTDVVFAAGNSGLFDPARLAGPYDRGHLNSIWGANGLPEVFTIGAIRNDGLAIGASSQGPSQPGLTKNGSLNRKPDFCAPSWFTEDLDPTVENTGTSAACAIFAGWLARVRAVYGSASSEALKGALGTVNSASWSAQTGHTITNPSTLAETPAA